MTPRSSFIPVSSDLLDADERESVLHEYARIFEKAGVSPNSVDDTCSAAPLVLFMLTGGTELRALEVINTWRESRSAEPGGGMVLLVAHPARNSLPAALEVLARLQQDGVPGRIVFLRGPCDAVGAARLAVLVSGEGPGEAAPAMTGLRALESSPRLSGRRVGVVGPPSDWLVASSPSPVVVKGAWGVDLVQIGMAVLGERIDAAARRRSGLGNVDAHGGLRGDDDFVRSFRERATEVLEPTEEDLSASGDVYCALRSLVDELRLNAITVRCFDLVVGRGATGCLAVSRLADEGVVAGCEGDVAAVLGMLWVRERLEQPSWMANPARVDVASNTLWLAHCTVPGCMVSDYALRSHFESGLGAAMQGEIPTGPVTLLRIGGRELDLLWVAEGEILSSAADETMCRTQVKVRLRGAAGRSGAFDVCSPVVDLSGEQSAFRAPIEAARASDLLERPLGNHLVLTTGWVADAICSAP